MRYGCGKDHLSRGNNDSHKLRGRNAVGRPAESCFVADSLENTERGDPPQPFGLRSAFRPRYRAVSDDFHTFLITSFRYTGMNETVQPFPHGVAAVGLLFCTACLSACGAQPVTLGGGQSSFAAPVRARQAAVGLGPVVASKHGGQIFGWAINENGSDGVLTETVQPKGFRCVSYVETFDQATGKITKVVARQAKRLCDYEYVTGGIVAGDVALIDDERLHRHHVRKDAFYLMAPVTRGRFTGRWDLPNEKEILLDALADQQSNRLEAIAVLNNNIEPARPEVVVSDVAGNQFKQTLQFPNGEVWGGPVTIAEDSATQHAVAPSQLSKNGAPVFNDFDLKSGKVSRFLGVPGTGPFQGVAIDSATDMMCTTTDVYSVEFYSLKTKKGFAEQLPGAEGQLQNGSAIAADGVNHLFLVTQPDSSVGLGSSVLVFDEKGNFIESVNGLSFGGAGSLGSFIHVNAGNRTGFVNGPGINQLQSFTY